MVAYFEGLRLTAYKCAAGRWTIGYGHTLRSGESHAPITKNVAREILIADFGDCVDIVAHKFPNLAECQIFALSSLSFNIGFSWMDESRNLGREVSALNRSSTHGFRSADIQRNVYFYIGHYVFYHDSSGKAVKSVGLVRRRGVERDFFMGLIPDFKEYIVSHSNLSNSNECFSQKKKQSDAILFK